MIVFPAIDIKNGNCVRLTQGNYEKETIYHESPIDVATMWEQQGATFLHIVDLDGAKTGKSMNQSIIHDIAKVTTIPIQVGGGIRSLQTVSDLISSGVDRVILGTAAIRDQNFLIEAVKIYDEKIAVSIDARNGYVATNGWTNTSTVKATDLLKELEIIGVKTIVYTDIFKDGMLEGPNLDELRTINELTTMDIIASGGISSVNDVQDVKHLNVYGAIIGKALYDGRLSLDDMR